MVGRFFGSSPSGGGGGGGGSSSVPSIPAQPLNTPKASSSSTTRRERIEQARQEKSRRRNFGFLKSTGSEKLISSSALSKRREHAKQLANLAYSDDPSSNGNNEDLTPTSRYARQQLLSSLDVDSPQNGQNIPPLDPFSLTNDSSMSSNLKSSKSHKKKYQSNNNNNNNPLFLDPHNVVAAGISATLTDREPTASTVDTLDTSSFGSTAFDMDFVAAAATSSSGVNHNNNAFGGAGIGGGQYHSSPNSYNRNNKTLENFFVESHDRNVTSMANSSMNAAFPKSSRQTPSQQDSSVASNQTGESGNSNSMGAAARRRMRSHMRNQSNNAGAGSNSSVGSSSATSSQPQSNTYQQQQQQYLHYSPSVDRSHYQHENNSTFISPPESPASSVRSNSLHRSNSNLSASKNRVAAYQQRSLSGGSGSNVWSHHQYQHSSSSFHSAGGNSAASSSNASASSPGIFDSDNMDGGFTFDAFGLDQSQVEREVNEAMQELAGQGITGFSIFMDKNAPSNSTPSASSKRTSYRGKDTSMANYSDDDTFTQQGWDSSPMSSRNASPVPSHHNYHSDTSQGEGFVDGFRIRQPSLSVVQETSSTPANSHGTNSASSSAARRLQRSLRRGATPSFSSPKERQQQPPPQQDNRSQPMTPPRWKSSPQSQPPTPSSLATTGSAASPQMSTSVFKDPIVSNPWKEDPWASDDGNNGAGSDFFSAGDTQSDVQDYRGSYGSAVTGGNSNSNRRLSSYSDAKTDIGVFMPSYRIHQPSFYQLPPEEAQYSRGDGEAGHQVDDDDNSDQSDDVSQMQEDLTREFAKDIVRRISPHTRQARHRQTVYGQTVMGHGQDNSKHNSISRPYSPEEAGPNDRQTLHQERNNVNYAYRQNELKENKIRSELGNSDYISSDIAKSTSTDQARKVVPASRFRNFRSKYESKARGDKNDVAKSFAQTNESSSHGARHYNQTPASHIAQTTTPLQVASQIEISNEGHEEQCSTSTSSNEVKSKIDSLSTRPKHKASSPAENSWRGHSSQSIDQSSASDQNEEEKKEDNDEIATNISLPPPKVGSLKARWEEKTRTQSTMEKMQAPILSKSVVTRTEKARESIGKIDNTFEMLTPDIVEARRQEKQKIKLANLRRSMGIVEDTRERMDSAKSDFVGSVRDGAGIADRILDRVRKELPREKVLSESNADIKSDGGSTPSFLSNIKLRKVASPLNGSMVSQEGTGANSCFQSAASEIEDTVDEISQKPVGRKLTYRERRDLQLQKEKEDKSKAPQETPKKDVASLIRKRIAANKQQTVTNSKPSPQEELSNIRGRLKPVEKENISLESAHSRQSPRPNQNIRLVSDGNEGSNVGQRSCMASSSHQRPSTESPNEIRQEQPSHTSPVSSRHTSSSVYAVQSSSVEYRSTENDYTTPEKAPKVFSAMKSPSNKLDQVEHKEVSKKDMVTPVPDVRRKVEVPDDISPADVKSMLSSFLGNRAPPALPLPAKEDDTEALKKHHVKSPNSTSSKEEESSPPPPPPPNYKISGSRPALKDDPKFERYFRMLKMGLPMEVAKHAMVRDGLDPSVLDLDPNKPVGLPLKEDPKFEKYFKMLKLGISMDQVKHSMEMDGLNPDIMNQDHNLPVITVEKKHEKKQKETHRRARLHWKTIGNVVRNSLWAKVETEVTDIDIDEEEFNELFKADLKGSTNINKAVASCKKKGAAVRVIDAKRANNGGIILARLKMTHDQMADAVDRIDSDALSAEQIENIIEYLPTKEEREALEKYMLEGGQDAAEKFDGLCECEKFMVSMMTVKHAKRKIRALLFKLQFMSCMESIAEDAQTIDNACDELSHSNRLRQLLGIILQFGNRLNTAGVNSKRKAGAFTLDSLLKLSEAKAFDKKTTFLHYIILIVQRNNELLLKFYDDLPTVLKADKVFWDQCLQDLEEVENQLENVRRISLHEARLKKQYKLKKGDTSHSDEDSLGDMELTLEEEVESLRATPTGLFTLGAIKQVSALRDKIDRTKAKFVRALEYFGEDNRKMQPHELFNIISSFTRDFQKAKEEVFSTVHKRLREDRKKARNQTPNDKKGLPPPGPERSAKRQTMKASDHPPNMSSLFNEIQERTSSIQQESIDQTKPRESSSERSAVMNSYRNIQYQSEIPEETPSQAPSTISTSPKETFRQKALRRQHQHLSGTDATSNMETHNISRMVLAPNMKSFSPNGMENDVMSSKPPTGPSPSTRSPRDALRNRRRLEAMRSRYPNSSSHVL